MCPNLRELHAENAEAGLWEVRILQASDTVNNAGQHTAPELQALGFPTQLDVVSSGGSPPP